MVILSTSPIATLFFEEGTLGSFSIKKTKCSVVHVLLRFVLAVVSVASQGAVPTQHQNHRHNLHHHRHYSNYRWNYFEWASLCMAFQK